MTRQMSNITLLLALSLSLVLAGCGNGTSRKAEVANLKASLARVELERDNLQKKLDKRLMSSSACKRKSPS